jgi:hypothetical protein
MPENQNPSTVEIDYLKSNFFRVIRVNGAFGGFSPDGQLFMAIFSERPPFPDATVYSVEANGQIGPEIIEKRQTTSKGKIVRELEAGLSMDVRTARAIVQWLNERIDIAEKMAAATHPRTEVKQ